MVRLEVNAILQILTECLLSVLLFLFAKEKVPNLQHTMSFLRSSGEVNLVDNRSKIG